MLRIEALPSGSPRIVPVLPAPVLVFGAAAIASPRAFPRSRFRLVGDAPPPPQIIPGGPTFQIQIPVNGIGTFHVVNGIGETASCDDNTIGSVFDPADPVAQGAVFVERSPHLCNVRGLKSGSTSIHVTRSNAQGIPIGLVRLTLVVGAPPPTGSFVSLNGTPVNPKGTGRMINIFGESTDKTPGFDNFTTDPKFTTGNDGVDRPFTNDPKKPPGIVDHKASDICLRDSPINQVTLDEMARIAMPGCRLTIALNSDSNDGIPGGTDQKLKGVRDRFVPAGIVRQEGPHNEISNFSGKPMVRKVLVIDMA
jgi:hypothetical protein